MLSISKQASLLVDLSAEAPSFGAQAEAPSLGAQSSGEGGIRTPVRLRRKRFSRPPLSTAQPPLRFIHELQKCVYNIEKRKNECKMLHQPY